MKRNKIIITEKQIANAVKDALNEYIVSNHTTPSVDNSEMIVEMARINKNESGKCIFPYNSWEVKIWSNDHTPPHFHILKDGWNVSFIIETGEQLQIDSKGRDGSIYDYMVNNVKEWLSNPCSIMPKLTNQENAILQWEQIHDN